MGLVNKRTRDVLVGTLAVAAAAGSLYFAFGRGSSKINLGPYEALGAITAEETTKLLGEKGQVLVVVRDTGVNKNPSVEAELKSFQQALTRHSGLTAVIERITVTPMLMMSTGRSITQIKDESRRASEQILHGLFSVRAPQVVQNETRSRAVRMLWASCLFASESDCTR